MSDSVSSAAQRADASGRRLLVETGGGAVVLFEVPGGMRAVEDGCLRCGASLLSGSLRGAVVTCRTCGWRYDVVQGCVVGLPALRVATYPVRGGEVD